MSQESTGSETRARRVIRRNKLPQFLGVGRSTIDEMIAKGLLHPFCPTGNSGRAQVVFEDEVAELQAKAMAKARRQGGRGMTGGQQLLAQRRRGAR
jgi:predicted DNA-binding transcriptional regulator AlpA